MFWQKVGNNSNSTFQIILKVAEYNFLRNSDHTDTHMIIFVPSTCISECGLHLVDDYSWERELLFNSLTWRRVSLMPTTRNMPKVTIT